MKHINFIESKSKIRFKFEFDYLAMILIAAGVIAVGLATHWILGGREVKQVSPKSVVKATAPQTVITGVAWSDWLKKYSTEFPKIIHLNKISGTTKDAKKIILEATAGTISDASRAKRNLAKMGLCKEVELKNINQADENVTFELECSLL